MGYITDTSFFTVKTQVCIINACCVLHNYMFDEQREWDITSLNEVDADLAIATKVGDDVIDDEVIRYVQVKKRPCLHGGYKCYRKRV